MKEFFGNSLFFAVTISLLSYQFGIWVKKKTKCSILNPLLVSIVIVIIILLLFNIDYEYYEAGSSALNYLLTPATVALAVPLYRQIEVLKKYGAAIVVAVLSGVLTSLISTVALAFMFRLRYEEYVTLLPKSITTAIGMVMSEELGGLVTITVAVIVVTGIIGNVLAEGLCRLFRIREKVAVGLALGTSAHAVGTARAMEMGEIEGAMSSVAIVLSGIFTVLLANLFTLIY